MDTDSPGSAGPPPRNRTALIRRRRRIVLTGLLGGLAVAVAVLAALPPSHTATTSVQVRPTGAAEAGGVPAVELDPKVQAQLVTSEHTTELLSEILAEQDGLTLSPAGGGSSLEVAADLDCSVPFVGSRIESAARPTIEGSFDHEVRLLAERLS